MDYGQRQQSLNPHKTVCVTVPHKPEPLNYVYALKGSPLSRVCEYNYLGVTILQTLVGQTILITLLERETKD